MKKATLSQIMDSIIEEDRALKMQKFKDKIWRPAEISPDGMIIPNTIIIPNDYKIKKALCEAIGADKDTGTLNAIISPLPVPRMPLSFILRREAVKIWNFVMCCISKLNHWRKGVKQ